eukprot:TRINITY_DN309_c0_g1_i1.p1 TRINITY_DN309_c0_g1~~TRINITY_DN309_c0_g1_i1.p1  ORF type:complete len:161 (-),score=21.69 TRINITY_DN309_c0_g1_i1:143-625(-)
MPHSFGYRARTRHLFARAFKTHGHLGITKYLTNFKIGDYVDVVGSGNVHKGMPHKYYHGKTGRIWNVSPRAVGVIVNKRVRTRIIPKRIYVRIEHVRKSACRDAFLKRVKDNDAIRRQAKIAGKKAPALKRLPVQPRKGEIISVRGPVQTVKPQRYTFIF